MIEQVTHQPLPPGAQRAESLLARGMLDMVVQRRQLASCLASLLRLYAGSGTGSLRKVGRPRARAVCVTWPASARRGVVSGAPSPLGGAFLPPRRARRPPAAPLHPRGIREWGVRAVSISAWVGGVGLPGRECGASRERCAPLPLHGTVFPNREAPAPPWRRGRRGRRGGGDSGLRGAGTVEDGAPAVGAGAGAYSVTRSCAPSRGGRSAGARPRLRLGEGVEPPVRS